MHLLVGGAAGLSSSRIVGRSLRATSEPAVAVPQARGQLWKGPMKNLALTDFAEVTVYQVTVADGVLLVDKPAGVTSHDVVAAERRRLPRGTKVGHAGTLDPFATGLLLVLRHRRWCCSTAVQAPMLPRVSRL